MSARRLLLVAPPFAGHLNPLVTLGRGLRERGFDVRFATGGTKTALLNTHGFMSDQLIANDPEVFNRIANTAGRVGSNPVKLSRQLSANLALLPKARAELDAIIQRDRPDAVLADFTAPVAGMAAEAHDVPWLTTLPTPFALETRTGTPSYCGGWGPARHAGHRLRDAAGRAATRATKLAMQRVFAAKFRAAGATVYRPDGSEAAYSPTAILGFGMTELELPRDWPSAFQMIGPVTATPEPWPVPPRLPAGPLILVTLGTHLHWAKKGLLGQVQAIAREMSGHTFVVSLGESDRCSPEPMVRTGNVVVFGHVPYDEVLPRCSAVVHHGGAGITYSAVKAAIPSLVCPQDYDQFDFAARIVAAGAGLKVRRLGSSESVATLRRVLDADHARLGHLADAAKRYDPVEETVRVLDSILH